MKICGIDPGLNGAMCVLDSNDLSHIALLDLKTQSIYDSAKWLFNHKPDEVWLEDVHSLYGMSAKSNFGFGKNLGIAASIASIALEGKQYNRVTPKVWQKYTGITVKGKEIKQQVGTIVRAWYPSAQIFGSRGGLLDGRADSILIAHYGLYCKDK